MEKRTASLTLSGQLTLATSAGNVLCPVSMGTTLTASSSAGHVSSFTVASPSECDLADLGLQPRIDFLGQSTHGAQANDKVGVPSLLDFEATDK